MCASPLLSPRVLDGVAWAVLQLWNRTEDRCDNNRDDRRDQRGKIASQKNALLRDLTANDIRDDHSADIVRGVVSRTLTKVTSAQPVDEQLVQPVGRVQRDPVAGAIDLLVAPGPFHEATRRLHTFAGGPDAERRSFHWRKLGR
jgi:hypothetical protein